ncbi:XRE family transcriptional regulator [Spongiivirga sp. MCCC 1A20706]|uniref:helix-turn-helix domain-containing protein n=1 Tax=Spongiivirga sp. MCCC 1A20706 TaxID=3160963 RepID=UPI003977C570
MEEEYIKLIFGLKLKQLRTDKKLSLFGLSKLTGLSKSYLNEIEKGKKYPKTDKIALLSEKLDVPYDNLVSLKLDKNLAPIGEILQSKILKEIPLDHFGIKESDLIDIISEAPVKTNTFISTVIEIAKHYNLSRESFYLASVRSYQESNNNYFQFLEEQVLEFAEAYQINLQQPIKTDELEDILIEEYGYTINDQDLKTHKELYSLRSIFVPKTKTLLLADHIDDAQKAFIYAKELAYNFLGFTDRLYTFSWIKFENFDQVLNNLYASYFAGALILPRKALSEKLISIFNGEALDNSKFLSLFEAFNASPESVYQRLTNILPRDFGLNNLFFLRFTHKEGSESYSLNKELHLTHQHSPHANESNEHYCRRWVSLKVIHQLQQSNVDHAFDLQISHYQEDNQSYLVLASATKDPFHPDQFRSISLGLLINKQLQKKISFIDDRAIKHVNVGVTCERCPVKDCDVRVASASLYEKRIKNEKIEEVVSDIFKKYND